MFDVKMQQAILILDAVARSKEPVQLKPLSKLFGIGFYTLAQIARRLRMKGLIKAKKGPGGGYVAVRKSVKDVSAWEIYDALYVSKEKLCTKNEQGQKVLASAEQSLRMSLKSSKLLG